MKREGAFIGRGGKPKPLVSVVLALMLFAGSLMGGDVAKGAADPSTDPIKIHIHTEKPESQAGVFDLKNKKAILEPPQGYVEITKKDSVLTAKKAVIDQSTDLAELSGDVVVTQKDSYAEAAKLQADLGTEVYILEGDVYLRQNLSSIEDQGTAGAELASPGVKEPMAGGLGLEASVEGGGVVDSSTESPGHREVWSDWMQVRDGGKELLARGNVHFVESDREAWADELAYDDSRQTAILLGNVRIETREGNVLTGAKVVLDLASDEAVMYGPTYGEFILESGGDD